MTLPKLLRLLLLFLAAWVCAIAFHLPIVFHPGPTTNLYPIHSHGKYGYVNQTGKLVVPPQFDDAREFFEGMGSVKVDDKWGAIDLQGKTIVPIEYDWVGQFSEGMVPVRVKNKWGFANTHGELSIPPQYDRVGGGYLIRRGKDDKVFSEGLASVRKRRKWGFIDRQGKEVIPFRFDEVTAFSEGVSTVRFGDFFGTIDTQGEWVRIQNIRREPDYDDKFFQGIRIEYVGSRNQPESLGMIYHDRQGRFIGSYPGLPPKLAREFHDGLAIVREPSPNQKRRGINYPIPAHTEYASSLSHQKCGFQDETGQVAIDLKFDQCRLFQEGFTAVKVQDKWGYVDRTGEFIAPPQFDYADDFSDGRALVISKGKYSFIDSSGQLIVPFKFDRLTSQFIWFDSPKAKFGNPNFDATIIESNSHFISKTIEPHRFYHGLAKIIQNDKCGYIDRAGKITIPTKFMSCSPFDEYGIAQAKGDSAILESIYLTLNGKVIPQNLDLNRRKIIVSILGFLLWIIAISVHEFGHAIVAYWGGDKSVKDKGYLSFNPIKYFHSITSLILPSFAFAAGGFILPGAAVYIEEERIRNRFWKSAMAAAGPMGSALFGLLLVPVFHFSIAREAPSWISGFLAFFIELQCLMTLFNFIPVPPLDGFRIIYAWFPAKWQNKTWFGWGSLMGLIFLFILPLFIPATAIVFYPMFDGVLRINESLGISENWSRTGFRLFDRTYTASFLLVVGLVYLSYKPKPILKATGTFLAFIVLITDSCVKVKNQSERSKNLLIAFDKCLKLNPDNSWLWGQKGWNLQKLNRHEEALAAFEKSLELNPKDSWAWGKKGFSLQQLNRHEEALTALGKSLELDPKNFWIWGQKGWNLQKLNRHEEALAAFEKSLELNPKDAWDWRQKGWNLQKLNRHEEAITALEKAIELNPKNSWAWGKKGWNLQQLKRHEESLTALEKSLELNSKDAWAWGTKGFSLQELNRHEEALAAFEKALELDPKDAWDWEQKGFSLQQLNRYEESLTVLETSLELNPNNSWAWGKKGFSLQQLKRHEEALTACEKALELAPKDSWAWGAKGFSLQQLNRHEEALTALEKAIELNPKDSWAWGKKGWNLQRLKRHEEAITALEKAIELDPKDSWAWGKKGFSLQALNRHEEALTALEKAIEFDPKDSWAWGKKGWNLLELNRHEEALTALEKSLELNPKDAWAWRRKGFLLQKLNHYEEALTACEKILELEPKSSWAWGKKGFLLQKLNRHEEALAALEKFIQGCDLPLEYHAFYISDVFEGYQEAIVCCEKVLQSSPENTLAWSIRGLALQELGCYDAAIGSYDLALEYQSDTQQVAEIWNLKGICFDRLKQYPEALESYRHAIEKAIELELPANRLQDFQSIRGLTLFHLNRREEAVEAYLQSQGMNPSSMQRPDGNLIEIYKP